MAEQADKKGILEPLRSPAFRRIFAGQGLAVLADQMFFIALTLLVLDVAGPGFQLGSVLAVASVPGAAFMLVGGWLSDKVSPATILVFSNAGRALLTGTLAALVLTDSVALWQIYILAGFLGLLDAFHYPAALSVVPKVVRSESLAPANALVQGTEQLGGIVGPALAAAAITLVGLGSAFGAFAIMFLATSLVILSAARLSFGANGTVTDADEVSPEETAAGSGGIVEGLRYVWRDRVILTMFLCFLAVNFATGPIIVGGAALAEIRLGDAAYLGVLFSAFGGGSLAGVALSSFLTPREGRRGPVILATMTVFGVFFGLLGYSSGLIFAVAIMCTVGVATGYLSVLMLTWLQQRTAPAYIGRVMSLGVFIAVSLDPLSYAFAGLLSSFSLEILFLTAGGLVLVAVVLGAASRELRKF